MIGPLATSAHKEGLGARLEQALEDRLYEMTSVHEGWRVASATTSLTSMVSRQEPYVIGTLTVVVTSYEKGP